VHFVGLYCIVKERVELYFCSSSWSSWSVLWWTLPLPVCEQYHLCL